MKNFLSFYKIGIGSLFLILIFLFQNTTTSLRHYEENYNPAEAVPLSALATQSPIINGIKVVTIPATGSNSIVYIDRSIDVGEIVINGQLHCDPRGNEDITIIAQRILVNGLLQCGTYNSTYNNKLKFAFKHTPGFSVSNIEAYSQDSRYRALIVNSGGKLILTGYRRNVTWVKLNRTVEANISNQITLDRKVYGWVKGDQIVIGSTSLNPDEAEVREIMSVNHTGATTVLTLTTAVENKHWGETESFNHSATGKRFTLDERAEVINITRNIKITNMEEGSLEDQMGAHVMVHNGGAAYVDSVEFHRMGQAGVMARYPFHWHVLGDAPDQFIRNSSIHESYQRCITIHKTNKVLVENNSCYDFRGHGFFLEDGTEVDNVIRKNIGIYAHHPHPERVLLASDNPLTGTPNRPESGVVPRRFPAVSVFWISHPQNSVYDNVASGSVGTGFWMAFVPEVRQFQRNTGLFEGDILSYPAQSQTTRFTNNTAHTCLVGITWDGAPDQSLITDPGKRNEQNGSHTSSMNNELNPADRTLLPAHYDPRFYKASDGTPTDYSSPAPVFSGLRAYKNKQTGIYFRGQTAIFDDIIVADNNWGFFLAYNQVVKNSAIIHASRNSSLSERTQYGRQRSAGVILYDGPFSLESIYFFNFPTERENYTFSSGTPATIELTATPLLSTGGAERFTNKSQQIYFSPQPYYILRNNDNLQWLDSQTTSRMRDIDGTLTGSTTPNNLIVPSNSFSTHAQCTDSIQSSKFPGFKICPNGSSQTGVTIQFYRHNAKSPILKVPFVARNIATSATNIPKNSWSILDQVADKNAPVYLNKVALDNNTQTYEVLFPPKFFNGRDSASRELYPINQMSLQVFAENLNTTTPLIKLTGLGSNCSITNAERMVDLTTLRSRNANSFYSNGNDLYIKIKSDQRLKYINTFRGLAYTPDDYSMSHKDRHRILCSSPDVISAVTGRIDTTSRKTDQSVKVSGWACEYGNETPIAVHIYAGGEYGRGGALVGSGTANVTSESNVGFACASTANGHRFNVIIPARTANTIRGRAIYVYGISRSGNRLLFNSGNLNVP